MVRQPRRPVSPPAFDMAVLPDATVVCVIGTPRSGTSLTARILNLAGVYLGPESEMRPAGPANPRGFWENRRIAALNRRLLRTLERDGLAPPRLPPGWAASEALEPEREEARALIAETFGGQRRWGWKEAGTTLVLPFWQRLLPEMRYVICLRNPVDVAASARRIDAPDASQAIAAWPGHVAAALAYTAGRPRIFVSYEDYLTAPRGTVERLWRFAGHDEPPGEAEAARLEEPIDDGLRHHRTPPAQTLLSGELPPATNAMYLICELRRAVTDPGVDLDQLEAMLSAHAGRVIGREAASAGEPRDAADPRRR
jgi:hypothetical protein